LIKLKDLHVHLASSVRCGLGDHAVHFGLQGFSRELQAAGGKALQLWLGRVTASRWRGFAVGALDTAVVQSSSAVTSLAAGPGARAICPSAPALVVAGPLRNAAT